MHKNGWRPFWAALGAALLVLLPLVLLPLFRLMGLDGTLLTA